MHKTLYYNQNLRGTTSFPRSSFVRPSIPRNPPYSDHSIDVYAYSDPHLPQPGLNPINKNLSSEKFSDKNLRILNPTIFSENLRNS